MATKPKSDWINNTSRSDGLSIWPWRERGEIGFEVRPGDGRPNISHCPCCGKTLPTVRAAKLVAETFYPLKEPNK